MESDYLDLYHPRILELDKHPYHFKKCVEEPILIANNPFCGDRFKLFDKSPNKDYAALFFYGHGCAVSKASTSLLVELFEQKGLTGIRELADQFAKFIYKETDHCAEDKLLIFENVRNHPSRLDCALLGWNELLKKLH